MAVSENLDLLGVGHVAVIARDSCGAPVLVFAHDADATPPVPLAVLRAHAHLIERPWLLQRLFPHRLPDVLRDCLRVVVVGGALDSVTLQTYASLGTGDLTVCELHEWSVAGRRERAIHPVLVRPERCDSGFSAPSATPPAALQTARELLTWLERLDTDVTVDGDRFARRVHARGRPLCTVAVEGADLCVHLPEGERVVLAGREDAAAVMDRVMTRFAAGLREPPADPQSAPASLDDLRRSVADVRVTRAEREALQFGEAMS